jgi:hypothetical protein
MQTQNLSAIDSVVDRYFISDEEIAGVKNCVRELKVESGIEQIAEVLRLKPRENSQDVLRLQKMDVSGFTYELAQIFLPQLAQIKEPYRHNFAANSLGQIVQYFGLDLWETAQDFKPSFLKDFLLGFKRYNAGNKVNGKAFWDGMGAGYLHKKAKEAQNSDKNRDKTPQAASHPEFTGPKVYRDTRRIEFNKNSDYGRRTTSFCKLMCDYGLVKNKHTIKGFFNAEDQSGSKVKCAGSKRNHIALLFDTMIQEEILILTGGKGHWKVLEECFVDEKGDSLSKSFSKLLSKLRSEEDQKRDIFDEIDRFMYDFKK